MKASFIISVLLMMLILGNNGYSQDSYLPDLGGPNSDGRKSNLLPEGNLNTPRFTDPIYSNLPETDDFGADGYNKCLTGLNGSANYVEVDNQAVFQQTVDGTIEAWVYITNSTNSSYIMAKGSTQATTAFSFYIQGNTLKPGLRMGNSLVLADSSVKLNEWCHVSVTWIDVGSDYQIEFYINGYEAGSPLLNTSMPVNTDKVRIGGAQYANGTFYGKLDEVRFFSRNKDYTSTVRRRWLGIGDELLSNITGYNLTSAKDYEGLEASWTFNSSFGVFVFENIRGLTGTMIGTAATEKTAFDQPLPYNYSLNFPQGNSDSSRVTIRDTTEFSNFITTDGSIEMWVRVLDFPMPGSVHLISKGNTPANTSFLLGINTSRKLFFNIAGNAVVSTGDSLPTFYWTHIAVSWKRNGSAYDVTFFVNGKQTDTQTLNSPVMPITTNFILLGRSIAFPGGFSPGPMEMDELRIWNNVLNEEQIKKQMFASSRALSNNTNLLAAWSFDCNLNCYGRFKTMRGVFGQGYLSSCYFKGYINDNTAGGINEPRASVSTTLRRGETINSVFPDGFYVKPSFKLIPDNNITGVSDTIIVGDSFPDVDVTSVELFLNIYHTKIGQVNVRLVAPDGTIREVLAGDGGDYMNVMTIFQDNAENNLSGVRPPWSSSVKPGQVFGNFGGSPCRGKWILKVVDTTTPIFGKLLGWGIRLNNQTTVGIQNVSTEIPGKYELGQNYPNPFNASTAIKFSLPKNGLVKLKVYDMLGREVASLVNKELTAGSYEYTFDGAKLSSGVYFYRIDAGDFSEVKKMTLIK